MYKHKNVFEYLFIYVNIYYFKALITRKSLFSALKNPFFGLFKTSAVLIFDPQGELFYPEISKIDCRAKFGQNF